MTEWEELRELDRRAFARLEDRFGTCPACGRGATIALPVTTVTWAACETCGVRWPVGEDVLEPHDGEVLALYLMELAQFDQLEPGVPHRLRRVNMPTPMPVAPAAGFDYLELLDAKDRQNSSAKYLAPECRRTIAAAIFEQQGRCRIENAARARVAHRVWESIRGVIFDPARPTRNVDTELSQVEVVSPISAIKEAIAILNGAGDLRQTLLDRRRQIDEALVSLDRLPVVNGR